MDNLDILVTIFKRLFQEVKSGTNIVSMIKDFVEKGVLTDCDALMQNPEADVELLVSKLTPQLINNESIFSCLSIMANHGVHVHNYNQLLQCITGVKGMITLQYGSYAFMNDTSNKIM